MATKGFISDEMSLDQALRELSNVLTKAKKDALNITEEEYDWSMRILKKYIKEVRSFNIIKDNLTQKQLLKILEEL